MQGQRRNAKGKGGNNKMARTVASNAYARAKWLRRFAIQRCRTCARARARRWCTEMVGFDGLGGGVHGDGHEHEQRYELEQDPGNMSDAKLTCTRAQLASARWAKTRQRSDQYHDHLCAHICIIRRISLLLHLLLHLHRVFIPRFLLVRGPVYSVEDTPCLLLSLGLNCHQRLGYVSVPNDVAIDRLTVFLAYHCAFSVLVLALRAASSLRPHSYASFVREFSSHTSPPTLVQTPLSQSHSRFRCLPVTLLSTRTLIRS
ncbi:hypothetical protein BKA62DRAFT_807870 [Auriculariales sp. MPI-PUGE-AT-0066]|nr:hypothetical protein BKA62DRAFT_807870 [Auriculariales sp. MPI-PUGE-AT-0066]